MSRQRPPRLTLGGLHDHNYKSPSRPQSQNAEWSQVSTADGEVYYWNKRTGQTTYKKPAGRVVVSEEQFPFSSPTSKEERLAQIRAVQRLNDVGRQAGDCGDDPVVARSYAMTDMMKDGTYPRANTATYCPEPPLQPPVDHHVEPVHHAPAHHHHAPAHHHHAPAHHHHAPAHHHHAPAHHHHHAHLPPHAEVLGIDYYDVVNRDVVHTAVPQDPCATAPATTVAQSEVVVPSHVSSVPRQRQVRIDPDPLHHHYDHYPHEEHHANERAPTHSYLHKYGGGNYFGAQPAHNEVYQGPSTYRKAATHAQDYQANFAEGSAPVQRGDWIRYLSDVGLPYYQNTHTGSVQWAPPHEFVDEDFNDGWRRVTNSGVDIWWNVHTEERRATPPPSMASTCRGYEPFHGYYAGDSLDEMIRSIQPAPTVYGPPVHCRVPPDNFSDFSRVAKFDAHAIAKAHVPEPPVVVSSSATLVLTVRDVAEWHVFFVLLLRLRSVILFIVQEDPFLKGFSSHLQSITPGASRNPDLRSRTTELIV